MALQGDGAGVSTARHGTLRGAAVVGAGKPVPREKVVVPAPEMTFELLNGQQAAACAADFEVLSAEVRGEQPARAAADGQPQRRTGSPGQRGQRGQPGRPGADTAPLARSFAVRTRQPGFALAAARSGGYLVGYACGMPLRPATSWWRAVTAPLPDEVTEEHPGRTFALTELAVRAAWRRQGIGRELHDLVLSGRPEERATLAVPAAAAAAQQAFRAWGWRKVGRARGADPAAGPADILLVPLPYRSA